LIRDIETEFEDFGKPDLQSWERIRKVNHLMPEPRVAVRWCHIENCVKQPSRKRVADSAIWKSQRRKT
jgi:hypothetical protein